MNSKVMTESQRLAVVLSNIGSKSDREIGQMLGMSKDSLRQFRKKNGIERPQFSQDLLKSGFDGENWSHGWLKTDTSSIFIKNEEGFVTYEDMKDELIAEMRKHAPKYPVIKRKKITDGHLLVIDPADVHINKLGLEEETGDGYDIEVAKQRCLDGVIGIIEKASGFPIEKIHFIIGNDILHTDNKIGTTTNGTPQNTSTMWWKAFREAKDLYVRIIEHLVAIADVEVIYCPSNHDSMSGFMLADAVASWFHKTPNVKFNVEPSHRKYVEYGLNMLGYDHGDGAKDTDSASLMAHESPEMWGRTKFRYVYKHHKHSKNRVVWQDGKDYIGATVEYLRSPSGSDSWHSQKGHKAPKAVEGFVHHRKNGQVARLVHYF